METYIFGLTFVVVFCALTYGNSGKWKDGFIIGFLFFIGGAIIALMASLLMAVGGWLVLLALIVFFSLSMAAISVIENALRRGGDAPSDSDAVGQSDGEFAEK